MTEIKLSPTELASLVEWLNKVGNSPHTITLIQSSASGIGRSIRAEIETAEGEGLFKDLTDYENW